MTTCICATGCCLCSIRDQVNRLAKKHSLDMGVPEKTPDLKEIIKLRSKVDIFNADLKYLREELIFEINTLKEKIMELEIKLYNEKTK